MELKNHKILNNEVIIKMFKIMKIPFKVSCIIPKSRLKDDEFGFITGFIDSKKRSNLSTLYKRLNNSKYKKEDLEELTIENKGFRLFLLSDQNIPSFRRVGGVEITYLEIKNDQLDNTRARYYIPVSVFDLIKILNKSRYIIDGEISGSYSLDINGTTATPVLEDPLDDEYKKSVEFGKLLATSKKTTKWIPGHLYVTTSGSKILYLGDINRDDILVLRNRWGSDRDYRFRLFANIFQTELIEKLNSHNKNMLIIEGISINESLPNSFNFNSYKGSSISDFIDNYINKYIVPKSNYYCCSSSGNFSIIVNKPLSGIDLGEFLVQEITDLGEKLKDIASISLKNDLIYGFLPDLIKGDLRDKLIKIRMENFRNKIIAQYRWRKDSTTAKQVLSNISSSSNIDLYSLKNCIDISDNELEELVDKELTKVFKK